MKLEALLLGENKIEDPQQNRKVLLGGYLILLYLIIDILLFFVNLLDPLGIPWVLISGVIVSAISLALLRKGKINTAIFLYLLRANAIVFYFSRQEDIETGTFIYFLSYGITPLAFFGYQERGKGIFYSLVSFMLFLSANFELNNFSPHHPHFNFIINYTFVLVTLSLIILFFDRINESAFVKIENQNKELIKTNEELDRFVYSVSHDLRAPLASILGLLNLYTMSGNPNEKDKIVEMIKGRTLKQDEFIKKILDYSRNSRKPISKAHVNVKEAIQEIMDDLRFTVGYTDIQFSIEIPEDLVILVDIDRLNIILSNIISNACRFRDASKGHHTVLIRMEIAGHDISLFVIDNGIGIPKALQGRIFEMFYRATQQSDGSGIGLYIAQECVHNLGGTIHIESEIGKGTTVKIFIPNCV